MLKLSDEVLKAITLQFLQNGGEKNRKPQQQRNKIYNNQMEILNLKNIITEILKVNEWA